MGKLYAMVEKSLIYWAEKWSGRTTNDFVVLRSCKQRTKLIGIPFIDNMCAHGQWLLEFLKDRLSSTT